MMLKALGLPEEYRKRMHTAFYDARFMKRLGDDCYSWSGNGTRSGKMLAIYAMLAEDGDDAIDMLREVENMIFAHQWQIQNAGKHAV